MRQSHRRRHTLVEPCPKIGEVLPERLEALYRRVLADEVGDQEPQEWIALQGRERRGRLRVGAQGVDALLRQPVDGSLSRLARLLLRLEVAEPGEPLRLRVVLALAGPVEHAAATREAEEIVGARTSAPDEAQDLVREEAQVIA